MPHKFRFNNLRSTPSLLPAGCRYPWLRFAKVNVLPPGSIALLLNLLLLMMLVLSGTAAEAGPGPGDRPPPLVTVAPVPEQDVNPPTEYVGHVEAIQSVELRARVPGYLEQVLFKEGSDVRSGDLLYVIEQAPYQAQVHADRARVDQARATHTKASQYLERARTVRSGGVSATDLDNAVADELQTKAQLQEAQATLERSELNLSYTTIKAPISGRIGRTTFTKGNFVGPNSGALARIVQLDPIRVVYSISENDLATIQTILQDASQKNKHPILVPRIRLPSGRIYKAAGRLDFINNEVDAGTGSIAVRAVFDNHEGSLLPGQYVTVLISRSEPRILPVVPQSAVQEDNKGYYVLVVDSENRVVQRPVKTGPIVGTMWAIESGLTANEKVIVQGIQKVRPGQVVQTIIEGQQKGR